jgi:hypothetical protein
MQRRGSGAGRHQAKRVVEALVPDLIPTKRLEPVDVHETLKERSQLRERQKIERHLEKLRNQQTGRGGLLQFVRYFWHTLEPNA